MIDAVVADDSPPQHHEAGVRRPPDLTDLVALTRHRYALDGRAGMDIRGLHVHPGRHPDLGYS